MLIFFCGGLFEMCAVLFGILSLLLLYALYKPKFCYTDFHRNFPAGKVVDTNHESRGHKW